MLRAMQLKFSSPLQLSFGLKDECFKMTIQNNGLKTHPRIRSQTTPFLASHEEEVMVLYDAPGEMNQEATSGSLQAAGFSTTCLARTGWNQGKSHVPAWRIAGTGFMGCTRGMLHNEE